MEYIVKCKHLTNTNTYFRNLSTTISIICINYLVMCSKFYRFQQGDLLMETSQSR